MLSYTQCKHIHVAHSYPALWKVNDRHHQESGTAGFPAASARVQCPNLSINSCVLLGKLLNLLISSAVKRITLIKDLNWLSWHLVGAFNWTKRPRGEGGSWNLKVCSSQSLTGTIINGKVENLKEWAKKEKRLENYSMKRVMATVTAYRI